MRLQCWYCHKSVSSDLPSDAVVRAICVCPECLNIHDKEESMDECPTCKKMTVRAKGIGEGGGVVCTNPDCNYWFCY